MGEVIGGRYVLCDPIGLGGTGVVWRAYDREQGRFCAAKLLRQRDAGQVLRFAREQSVRIRHPNVVSPYAWAADDGLVLIASELIDGGSLHTLLGDYGPLADGTIADLLDQVLAALGAVHDAQLIHRDVKPGNLLLRAGSGPVHVLLTDFGLTIGARDARLTEVGTVIGTPGYLPPEVLSGATPPDVRHDLYAVGRLALTMHAGVEVTDLDRELAQVVDPALRRAVRTLVAQDPDERPADTSAARALLTTVVRDDRARTRDGEPVIVLNQLPPLPNDGFSVDAGRPTEVSAGPGTRVDASITEISTRVVSTVGEHAASRHHVAGRLPAAGPAASEPVADHSGAGIHDEGPGFGPSTTIQPPTGPSTAGRRSWLRAAGPVTRSKPAGGRRPRGAVTAGWVGGIASLAVTGVVLVRLGAAAPGEDVPAREAPPTSGAPSGSTAASGTFVLDTACGWQQEGDRGSTTDGVILTCMIVNGAYRWRASG